MTSHTAPPDQAVESLVGRVADEFTRRLQEGEQPDIEVYARRHPEVADLLRQVLAALQVMGPLSAAPVSSSGMAVFPGAGVGRLGDFRLRREVGRGGMGVVYEAEQVSLGRRVALKVLPFAAALDAKQLQRFHNEAQAAAHLHHPHIVPVIAVGTDRGVHYYAMQLIEGRSLAEVIQEWRPGARATGRSPLAPADPAAPTQVAATPSTKRSGRDPDRFRTVARLGVQAAQALEHAHQLGVVHRDIKPGNLLVDGRGDLWVTDFGLAQVRNGTGLTMSGDLVGTLRYMSPEQALAKRGQVDHRTDVYALGATLYELLTLEPVFDGTDRQELLRQIAQEEPRPPRRRNPAIPAELATVVLKALAKEPGDRYATAQELADDLQRFLDDKPIKARRPTLRQVAGKWARRHRGVVTTAGVAALAGLVLAVLGLAIGNWRVRQEQGRTEEALRRAELNVQLAMQALNDIYLRLLEERFPRDGRQMQADRRLLGRALEFYQEVARANGNNPRLQGAVLGAWLRVGDIQEHLGQADAAKHAYRRAIDLGERLAAESPADFLYRGQLALGHDHLATLLVRTGATDEALGHFRQALDLWGRLAVELPDRPDFRQQLANSHDQLAQLWLVRGELDDAEDHFRQGQAMRARLAEDFPQEPRYRQDLAGSHNSLGNLLRQTGDLAAAEQHYRRALDLKVKLATESVDHPLYRRTLAMSQRNLGAFLADRDRAEADRLFRQALDLQVQLVAEFPAVPEYRRDLADTQDCLGQLAADGGNRAAAGEHFAKALELRARLAAEVPGVPLYRQDLAAAEANLGAFAKAGGDLAAAERRFRRALELETPGAGDPPPLPDQRESLAISHFNLGQLLVDRADRAGAESHLREALALRTRLVTEFPKVPRYRQAVANSHHALGDLYWEGSDRSAAADHYRQALKLWTALTAEGSAGERGTALNELAWFLATCADEQFRNPARSVELARQAVAWAPQHGEYWITLGAAHYRAGDPKAAVTALDKAVQLRHGGDCLAWLFLALAHAQLGEREKARASFDLAAAFLDRHPDAGEELRRLRTEAADRLGISDQP